MKVCTIYNEYDKEKTAVAYLIYYESESCFYIEIDDNAEIENVPMLFALFMQKGIYSIDSVWSKKWVCSRIIPPERQNLGQILKANNMPYYDEYKFLIKSKGKCSHDDFCVEEISIKKAESTILKNRESRNIKSVVTTDDEVMIFFRDDLTKKYKLDQITQNKIQQKYIKEHIDDYVIMPGGYELNWNDIANIHVEKLRDSGEIIPISIKYFEKFIKNNLINTAQTCEMLDCSRQNVEDMVKRNRLVPIHSSAKNKMFLKSDVEEKLW